jgi:hypothetical protein
MSNILINTFCACALKLLILKILTETLLRIFFSVIGRCFLVATSHWLQGARINLSKAALSVILQNHRRLPVSIFSIKITAESGNGKDGQKFKGAS